MVWNSRHASPSPEQPVTSAPSSRPSSNIAAWTCQPLTRLRPHLLDQAKSLREADEIRAYVTAVRERQAALDDPLSATGFQQWADWALSQADRIDPGLSDSFRTVQDDD